MPVEYGAVGAPSSTSAADGSNLPVLQGKLGEFIYSELHGKYFTQNYRNNLFFGATAAAGLANSIFSNTTFVGLMLWNPTGSGKLLSVVRSSAVMVGVGTTALSSFGYAFLPNCGAGVATAAPITAFTAITATRGQCNAQIMGQGNSVALVGGGATCTAQAWLRNASYGTGTGAATVALATAGSEDLDGSLIIPPGMMVSLTTDILNGGTFASTLIWEEIPI